MPEWLVLGLGSCHWLVLASCCKQQFQKACLRVGLETRYPNYPNHILLACVAQTGPNDRQDSS